MKIMGCCGAAKPLLCQKERDNSHVLNIITHSLLSQRGFTEHKSWNTTTEAMNESTSQQRN